MKLSDHEQVVLKAIEHVAGSRNGLASVPAVTRAVGFPISTTQKILAALHRKEIIALHHHDYPAQMTADEKKRAVKIGNDYFHAVAIRNPATMGADPKEYVLQHRAVGTATGWLNYGVYYENEMEAARKDAKRFDHARLIDGDTEYSKTPKVIFEVRHNPAGNMKRGAAKKNPSPAQLKARAAFTRMAKKRAAEAKKANPRKRRASNPRYLVSATDARGNIADLGVLVSPNKTQAVARAKKLYKGYKKFTAAIVDKGDYIGPKGVVKIRRKRPTKKANGIAKTAGKAIKKVTRAVLGGVSKVAGKGAKALKNPRMKASIRQGHIWNAVVGLIRDGYTQAQSIRLMEQSGFPAKDIAHAKKIFATAKHEVEHGRNPARRKNLDHRDSSHQVKVHQHWRAGGLSQWQRAHHAGQHDLFSHGIKAKPKRNPSAKAIRKKFAGRVSGSRELYFPKGAPQGMAKLGRLVSIKLKGGKLIKPSRKNPSAEIWLCSDTSGKLWLGCTKAGPLYSGAPGDLGEMSMLEYAESKPHIGYPSQTIWFHKMGEVSGRRPHLIVNDDQDLLIKGGNYKITRAGIVD